MAKNKNRGYGFGTTPVFLASISTILGAILFLRFGYAVSNAGLIGTILLVLIAHLITIPSALAISEIATNMRVEGGGEYYIISRSFGKIIGGSIGISLYFARAISVAFYMVAFADAFRPINQYLMTKYGIWIDLRIISLLFFGLITWIQLWKGANMGVNILWGVFLILIASIILFLFGKALPGTVPVPLTFKIKGADPMFKVFAIIFPAFTGMAAGVGLSGDLKKPERSIPIGILSATITGMFIYILVAIKLHSSAPMSLLASDPLVMSKIALWGPIIPLGLAAATISSAISSSIVAPRILQALGNDNVLPGKKINRFFAKGKGKVNEPVNATAFTVLLVILFILPGSLDFIAQLITMFFIITYGILCWISFLEHMAANPSFRPVFHTKWYISLIGGIMSIIVIFQIQPIYATLAILLMFIIYRLILYSHKDENELSTLSQGLIFQITRWLKIISQRNSKKLKPYGWRPSVIAVSKDTFERISIVDLLRWISYRHGFGTLVHFIQGMLNKETAEKAVEIKGELVKLVEKGGAGIYVDTIVSPSKKSAVAQIVQLSGVSGLDNNTLLLEFPKEDPSKIDDVIDAAKFALSVRFNILILRSSSRHFGYKSRMDIWITDKKYRNSNLLILLAYIIKGHPDWREAQINIFVAFPESEIDENVTNLKKIIESGRLPISFKNIRPVSFNPQKQTIESVVEEYSETSDLVIIGFNSANLDNMKGEMVKYNKLNDLLFVSANENILII